MGIRILTGLGLATALGLLLAGLTSLAPAAIWTASVTCLCGCFWVLQPIPIAATSLIPFAAFPLLGVASHKEVARGYGHTLILLLLGGFILSKAIESVGAHRRIALGMVRLTGGGPRRLVLGFMLASALCSMWISNSATTLMLLPVALAVLAQSDDDSLAVPLLLGIAYAASIGGVGTPIGTPPNVFFVSYFYDRTGVEYDFLKWMKIGVPVVVVMLPLTWLYLTRNMKRHGEKPITMPALGPLSSAEFRVTVIFALTAAAWIFRAAPAGGWSVWLGAEGTGDSTVALTAVIAVFLIPDAHGKPLMTWKQAESIPWGLLILFGGGIAIANAFESSGLAHAVGESLAQVVSYELVLVMAAICLAVTFMTEVISNTAATTLLLPLLFPAALAAGLAPEKLLIPATLSASFAFMLPVATAPNAIVFGTGRIDPARMLREGVALNLLGVVVIATSCLLLL